MFDTVGFPVTRLARIAVGPVRLGDLKPGRRRHLQPGEVQSLYRAVGL
jgi:23S rRNA pseudouridine2605 synthase